MAEKSKSPEKHTEDSPHKPWSIKGPPNINSRIFDFEEMGNKEETKLEMKLDKIIWWVNTKYHHPDFKNTIVDSY